MSGTNENKCNSNTKINDRGMIEVKEKQKYLSLGRAYKWAEKWGVKLVWSQEDIRTNSVELRKNKSSNLNAIETYSNCKMLKLKKNI